MQLLVPIALVLLSFNVTAPPKQPKSAPNSRVNVIGSQTQTSRFTFASTSDALRGISGLHIVVEDLDEDAKAKGLNKEDLTRRAELVLRRNGIQVHTRNKFVRTVGGTFLYINVQMRTSIYSISVECRQNVRSIIDPNVVIVSATIWDIGSTGGAALTTEGIDHLLDMFCDDFRRANPK